MFPWNAVIKFVHTLFENKSSDMAEKVGIFIRSAKSNDDIIAACSNLIRNSNSCGKITAVKEDKLYGGVKVYFNRNDIVKELIGKRFLFEMDDKSTIHPLTTHLTVHDAIFSGTEEEFIDELQNIIQEAFGPVLKISKIPISELHPDIGNGNWRVLLDVPEIEDLDVFKISGLPEDLKVKVPGVHEKLPVTFYCTKCDKDGHTQWRCSESTEDEMKSVLELVRKEDSTAETSTRPLTGFFIRDHEEKVEERDVTPINKPLLKRRNIKQFESEIGKEEVRNYFDSDSYNIKKEVGESSFSADNFSRDDREPNLKKPRISTVMDDDIHSENLPKASSTTNDADPIEILYEGSSPSKILTQYFPLASAGGLFRNSVDDSVSTSNQPAAATDTIKSELPSTDENDSDSNQSQSRPKPVRQRKKPAQSIPIVIPDRIQSIISEIDNGVLNVQQLTAFFNHVKKKSKPCKFAEMYTTDVAGLKRQLFEIQKRYYMIPDRGTNAEIQFMKWFVNILDRFDGTSTTRKKKSVA